jgi:hypothetical protein
MERRVVLKRFSSFTGGNTEAGQAPTRNNVLIEMSCGFRLITGKDILLSNGLYAIGDSEITTEMPVFGADNRNVTQADKMLLDGQDYTMVGKPYPVPMGGGTTFYKSVWRRAS